MLSVMQCSIKNLIQHQIINSTWIISITSIWVKIGTSCFDRVCVHMLATSLCYGLYGNVLMSRMNSYFNYNNLWIYIRGFYSLAFLSFFEVFDECHNGVGQGTTSLRVHLGVWIFTECKSSYGPFSILELPWNWEGEICCNIRRDNTSGFLLSHNGDGEIDKNECRIM